MFQFNKINLTILAAGLALAPFLPGYAHATSPAKVVSVVHRSADPIGDIIGQRMGWDKPAPTHRSVPAVKKPTATPSESSTDDRRAAERAGVAASKAARDARFAMAFADLG